ncbi:ent-kaurene oxidase 2 isoform X2 [Cryptomeria japonica]|uniref:ent-kaurene oxidase 2 isoform X2 n=1 Tax=Cryptomeria japonica TaxID=3369 RepID=UPI0027DA9FE0|nr:ent-kaurene oxidase 2 isoform X2 [Cryptomeria japonica]
MHVFTSYKCEQALVTKYMSISSRKLPRALQILTRDKTMVAMSDYGDEHRLLKQVMVADLLSSACQMHNRFRREEMIESLIQSIHRELKGQARLVDLSKHFKRELFSFVLKEVFGREVESIYVEELGISLSQCELFDIFVRDFIMGAVEVDWRDLFPYLKWMPNNKFERRLMEIEATRTAVIKAMIREQKQLNNDIPGEKAHCYLNILLREERNLSENQVEMLTWEAIIESVDTVSVTWEWLVYELAKNPKWQECLYNEIIMICEENEKDIGEEIVGELVYLKAVFEETLRKHPPVPLLPLRYVHHHVNIEGYDIPPGWQIAINAYGCNHNEEDWKDSERWDPERMLTSKKIEGSEKTFIMTFGDGRRACAGKMKATLILCTSLARFLQHFRWELNCEDQEYLEEIVDRDSLTMRKQRSFLAIVTPRNVCS